MKRKALGRVLPRDAGEARDHRRDAYQRAEPGQLTAVRVAPGLLYIGTASLAARSG
jgi:hypothetical protein